MGLNGLRTASATTVACLTGLASLAVHGVITALFPAPAFRKYTLAAELFADGTLAPERLVDFSPLYLQWAAAMRFVSAEPEAWMLRVQWLLAAATVAVFFLWLDHRLGRVWALLGATVLIFDRHLLVYQRVLEPEVLFLFLLTLFLWLIDRPNGLAHPFSAGVVGALGMAVRPTFLPLCILALLWWGFQRRGELRSWIKPALLFSAPLALCFVLLTIRSHGATGSFRAPTMNPGTVFFEGNQPMSKGTSAIYPPLVHALQRHPDGTPDPAHAYYRTVARKNTGEPLGVGEVNQFWIERATAFWLDHPAAALRRLNTKLQYIFHGFRWHDLPAAWVYDRYLPVPGVPFALLSALGLPGLLLELRRRRDSLMLYAVLGSQMAVMLVFYVSPRQRLILIPLLIYFAFVTLDTARKQRLYWPLLLSLALFPVFSLPDDAMLDRVYQQNRLERTRVKLEAISSRLGAGEPMAAMVDDFADAMADSPWWLEGLQPAFVPRSGLGLERLVAAKTDDRDLSPFDRAQAWIQAGELQAARALLLKSIDNDERFYRQGWYASSPRLLLARLDALAGHRPEARERLAQALESAPGDAYLLAELFAVDPSPELFTRLSRYYGAQDAHFLVGRALMAHHDYPRAIEHLNHTVTAFPQLREVRLALAAALAETGRRQEALDELMAADRVRSEPVHYAEQMAALYRWSATEAGDSQTLLLRAAQGLFHYGRPAEALALLDGVEGDQARALRQRLRASLSHISVTTSSKDHVSVR